MSERSIRGQVAVVGVGETKYYKRGQSPDPEFLLGLKAILAACEDAGIDAREIDGFASYSNDPERSVALRGRPRAPRAALLEHAVGRRGRGRLRRGGKRRGRHRGRLRELRGRVPLARPGPVRPLRGRRPARSRRRGCSPVNAVWADVPGADVRDACPAPDARVRHQAGRAPSRITGLVLPRAAEPAGGHAREAAHRGVVRQLALDRRALSPVRLLPRERWGGGTDSRSGRARPRLAPEAGVPARRGPGLPAPGRRGFPQQSGLRDGELQDPGPHDSTRWRRCAPKTWTSCRATRISRAA